MVVWLPKLHVIEPKHKPSFHVDALTCGTKYRLLTASFEATQAYGGAAEELYKAAGDCHKNFQALQNAANDAHLKCEKARIALHMHRTEHGC